MNANEIANGLDDIAMGRRWDGEALREAEHHPAVTFWDRLVIRRYQHGINSGTDHIKLQQIANILRSYYGED